MKHLHIAFILKPVTLAALSFTSWIPQAVAEPPRFQSLNSDSVYSDAPTLLVPRTPRDAAGEERLKAQALVLDGRIRERRGQQATALRKYQRAWRLDSSNAILKQIVPLALELGRVEEATRYALLLTDSDLDDPFLAERLAMLMSDQLKYDQSLQLYQRVLKLRGDDPESRNPVAMQFEMGRLYFLTNRYKQAAQSFRVVVDALESEDGDVLTKEFRKALLKDAKSIYTLVAESFLESGDYAAAEQAFEKANVSDPNQQWLTFQLARVDYRAGRYKAAQEKLESYVGQKLRFGGQAPYELLNEMMEKARDETQANNVQDNNVFVRFRDWLADDPENFPLMSYVAELTRREGVLKDAAVLYEQSIERSPNPSSYKNLITIYRDLADTDKLAELLGNIVAKLGSFDGFEDQVESIVADPKLCENLYRLGRQRLKQQPVKSRGIAVACGLLALEAKDYPTADEFLKQATKGPNPTDLHLTWGLQLLVNEEYAKAARVFEAGLGTEPDPNSTSVLKYYLSGALQLGGRTEDALKVASDMAGSAGHIPEFALRPSWILYNANQSRKAQQGYKAWLDRHAEDYSMPGLREVVREARFVISNICVEQGELDDAIEWLEKVLDEYPQNVSAMNDLGYLLVDNNKSLHRATKMIRFAVAQDPDNVMYRDSLGWALFRLKKFDEAIVELQKASSEEQPDPIILDHLAEAQLATGDTESSHKTWRRALSHIKPNTNHELREKIEAQLNKAETH